MAATNTQVLAPAVVTPTVGAGMSVGNRQMQDQLFSQHQQLVSMVQNQDRVMQTLYGNLRSEVIRELQTISANLNR